jgi:uncharacterized protein YndB with AHSA1/START domain
MEKRTLKRSVSIHAPVSKVWSAITDPATIKEYFFGTNVETDWKEGSPITYYGTWQGKEYRDKGMILEVQKERKLKHTHWSSLSGTPDEVENYFTVTYELEPKGDETILTVTQSGLMTEETKDHSGKNWEMVLQKLKDLLEKQPVEN